MERRTLAETVAANVSSAIDFSGTTPAVISEATDMGLSELDARLRCETPFKLSELVRVGGFLRVSPASFLEGVRA